jgi:hypothetical protein
MEVELLRNDSNKQASPISESVAVIQINIHLTRKNLTTRHMHGHEDPTCGNSSQQRSKR